jgi:hypothetical protein
MKLIMISRSSLLLLFSFLASIHAISQTTFLKKVFSVPYDTNYISSYITDYTTRIYGSVKYGQMGYNDNMIGKSLAYRPNNKLLLGIGANHGILGINIGLNFPFVNQDDEKYGETDYTDLTMRIFAPRFNTTIYLQRYKGFYLKNTKDMIPGWMEGDPYYIRSDIRSYTVGLDISYIFNSGKFSYRAAVLQNEWQKKSAGSLLIGASLIYNATIGDSSLVPSNLTYGLFYNDLRFKRSNNFAFGPLIGYAHTFVIKKHFFIMGSINGSGTVGFTRLLLMESEDEMKSGLALGWRSELIISAGYNSDRWYFGVSFMNMSMAMQSPLDERSISYDTGMYRFNIVRRFATKKPIRILNPGMSQ